LLCGKAAELKSETVPGYQEPDLFSVYHCPHCSTAFSFPRVDAGEIYNLIYSRGKEVSSYHRYWQQKEDVIIAKSPIDYLKNAEETYWSVITTIENSIDDKQNAQILEVGCGMGYLTYALNTAGYNVTGLDISQEAVNEANRSFGEHYIAADIYKYAPNNTAKYDIVVLTEVIEHIETPTEFLQQLVSMLKPDGKVLVTTPNKIFADNVVWNSDLPPVHTWWFSEKSFEYIASKINCNVSFVDFRKFYKSKKPVYIYLNINQIQTHRFRKNSQIMNSEWKGAAPSLRQTIKNSELYKRFKSLLLPHILYKAGKKGNFLCAIFTIDKKTLSTN
jgi:2-polyprenyl-3-methyl-5-hydroxy-6-metoxy-1,4-benzoquinol methylase